MKHSKEQEPRRQLECKRCGWRWFTKLADVKRCARCKSPYWDVARGHSENPQKLVVKATAANIEHDQRCPCGVCAGKREK